MRKIKFAFPSIIVIIIATGLFFMVLAWIQSGQWNLKKPNNVAGTIPNEYGQAFNDASVDARAFYDSFRLALRSIEEKKYDSAIELLNELIPHAHTMDEKAMIYNQLVLIYREKGDLENELINLREYQHCTLNDKRRNEASAREADVVRILNK